MDGEETKKSFRWLWLLVLVAAVVDALRHNRKHGELFGFVPYDFRIPTTDRAKRHTWNPSSTRILTPTTFGIGWSVNFGRLARLAHLV